MQEVVRGDVDRSTIRTCSPRSRSLTHAGACSKWPRNMLASQRVRQDRRWFTPLWRTASAVCQPSSATTRSRAGSTRSKSFAADGLAAEEARLVRDNAFVLACTNLCWSASGEILRETPALDLAVAQSTSRAPSAARRRPRSRACERGHSSERDRARRRKARRRQPSPARHLPRSTTRRAGRPAGRPRGSTRSRRRIRYSRRRMRA